MRYIKAFFMGLGVVFFVLILITVYMVIVDPFHVKPLISILWSQTSSAPEQSAIVPPSEAPLEEGAAMESAAGPGSTIPLSSEQTAVLETVGIDPSTLPTSISPAQEACFIEQLGADRVEAIMDGAAPTPLEIWQARECL